jgi:hypothetical protein
MRQKTIIITGGIVFFLICAILFGVRVYVNNMKLELEQKYKSATDVYLEQIEAIGSKKEIEAILKDSLPSWREKDREMIADHLEELQFYIDEYNDIRAMPNEKVDKVYRNALEDLVKKYRSNELKPVE